MPPSKTSPSSETATQIDSLPSAASTENRPWDKLPDEPQIWYDRFITFLGLGPRRTIEETYRERRKIEKGLSSERPNSDWHRRAKTYQWEDRSTAYDRNRQQRYLEAEETRRIEARENRRGIIQELLGHVYKAIIIADLPTLELEQARRHLPTLRALLHDILQADRLEMGEPTEIQANATTGIQFSADDLAEAQRQLADALEAPKALTPPQPINQPPTATGNQTQLLVVVGDQPSGDNSLAIDISVLRGVSQKTGLQFHRIINPTAEELEAELIRARRHGIVHQYMHMAVHACPDGIELKDGTVDGDWLSARLAGTEILLLAGCRGTAIGDWLSVIPFVITFDEEISHQNAAAFSEGFWTSIAKGCSPDDAVGEALRRCVPSTREYIHKHW